MPAEVFDEGVFLKLSEAAKICSVKRNKDSVKLKLRTIERLYTFKVEPSKAEELIKKLKCKTEEI